MSWLFWGPSAQPEGVGLGPGGEMIAEVRARLVPHGPEKLGEDVWGDLALYGCFDIPEAKAATIKAPLRALSDRTQSCS